MTAHPQSDLALALVHEGWNHLMSQRPLAAWGAWQRALRLDPELSSARQALGVLESSPELPQSARKVYRFRQPTTETQRSRWNATMQGRNAEDLADAADLFGALAAENPDDAQAWYNRALCLSWLGHNREAIECLDRAVNLEAGSEPDAPVEAWSLAEILRQGGGAETMSDDLRFTCTFRWNNEDTPRLLDLFPELRRTPTPKDPTRPDQTPPEIEVLEWLDRPLPATGEHMAATPRPARVMATVFISKGSLRLSSTRAESLEEIEEQLRRMMGEDFQPVERLATPPPLPFLDADLWTTRLPEGGDRASDNRFTRETVEFYYESIWIHRPRMGLDGLPPLAAARAARHGDAVAKVKLQSVVAVREELGSRPSAVGLYQGYPFDRLRRRLGLEPTDSATVDSADLTCACPWELAACDPQSLDDARLADAFESAVGLRDDALATPLAAELCRRGLSTIRHIDLKSVLAPLVREDLKNGDANAALDRLDRARIVGTEEERRTLEIWRAEILTRIGRTDDAVLTYEAWIDSSPAGAILALDAAETFIDSGYLDQARPLLIEANDLAQGLGLAGVAGRARMYLETHG